MTNGPETKKDKTKITLTTKQYKRQTQLSYLGQHDTPANHIHFSYDGKY